MNKIINVLSVFDGLSCGQIALNRAGIKYDNYFASEIDEHAIKVTKQNFPNTLHLGDVTKVNSKSLPKIDLLIGGSPCQGFSIAGGRLNFEDPRSKLFFEFVRLKNELNPTYFLLENVKMKKEWQNIITQYLGVEPIEINSKLVSGQNRPRLYWTNIPNVTQPEDLDIVVEDILMTDEEIGEGSNLHLSEKAIAYMSRLRKGKPRWDYHTNPLKGKAACLTANMYKGVPYGVIKEKMRRLHPIECERLQTVPDNYTASVSNTQRYKMLGNGWTIDVITHILKKCEF